MTAIQCLFWLEMYLHKSKMVFVTEKDKAEEDPRTLLHELRKRLAHNQYFINGKLSIIQIKEKDTFHDVYLQFAIKLLRFC